MATSDNVVRAGLTPKLRDVPTLVEMLTYESGPASKQLLKPETISPSTLLYDPPIAEFSVFKVNVEGSTEKHRAIEGPSICVVTEGKGNIGWEGDAMDVEKGEVLFVGAGVEVEWKAEEKLEVFRAYVEA